jgi:hypothetical protein
VSYNEYAVIYPFCLIMSLYGYINCIEILIVKSYNYIIFIFIIINYYFMIFDTFNLTFSILLRHVEEIFKNIY